MDDKIREVHESEQKRIIHLKVDTMLRLYPTTRSPQLHKDIEELMLEILKEYQCNEGGGEK